MLCFVLNINQLPPALNLLMLAASRWTEGGCAPNPPWTTLPYLCGGDPRVFYTLCTPLTFTTVIYELAQVSFSRETMSLLL